LTLDIRSAGMIGHSEEANKGTGIELESPTSRVYGGMIKGRAEFIKEALKKLKEGYEGKAEISHRWSLRPAGSADEIVTLVARSNQATTDNDVKQGRQPEAKKIVIYLLKKYTGMTNGEIGKQFGGLSCSAIAKAFSRLEETMKRDGKRRTVIKKIETQMSNVNSLYTFDRLPGRPQLDAPIRNLQPLDLLKLPCVVGDKGHPERKRMCTDQHIHGTYGFPLLFKIRPYHTEGPGRPFIEVGNFERQDKLFKSLAVFLIMQAFGNAVLKFCKGDG